MQTTSLSELKKELSIMPKDILVDVCTKLIRFKKENKELLHYLLFESNNEQGFINNLKLEVDMMFEEVNTQTVYWAKKTIRKILRWINRYCKYSGLATTYIELLSHFCVRMKSLPLDWSESKVLLNIYESQVKKINKYILTLHEDLQFDFRLKMESLNF
ncbi:MAG TPA: hypothetical protein PKC41_08545 [Chitinophagaceae bacterium]|jgi:uncharacterized protein YpuA (DUF1002 family)|nr:hypothetical protein [Chitinophagaceae bacterium]